MESRESGVVLKAIDTLFTVGSAAGLTDGELLERFAGGRDHAAEAAFAALVQRHGPMVLRVCRGVLRDAHAAEDALQATFLILARKCGAIRKQGSVASWLYGVARRVAIRAKRDRDRRTLLDRRGAAMAGTRSSGTEGQDELGPELQEEVDRLPEKYRAPIVLHYFEGLTHEQAASQLRLPVGTVKIRLLRARERLRGRFARRGLAPGGLLPAPPYPSAEIPSPVVDAIARAAVGVATGRAAGTSVVVTNLVKGVIRTMFLAKLKTIAALLATTLTLLLASFFVIAALSRPVRSDPPAPKAEVTKQTNRPINELPPPEVEKTGVVVMTTTRATLPLTTSQPVSLHAAETVKIVPQVSGAIQSMRVDIGDRVNKGQVLAAIDTRELELDLNKSQAEKARAVAQLMKAQAALKVAESSLASIQSTFGSGNRSRVEIESAKAMVDEAKANLAIAKAEVNIADEAVTKATYLRSLAEIHSPLDGVVTQRNYFRGEFVRSSAASNAAPMFRIMSTENMRAIVMVPDRDVRFLDIGDPVKIQIDSLPGREFVGKITRTAYAIEPGNRTLRAEVDLNNKDGLLRPGQYGAATILLETLRDRLVIHQSALGSSAEKPYCFRVRDGKAVRTEIRLGVSVGERVEVVEGLKEGDSVIVGLARTKVEDGQQVIVLAESPNDD